MTSEREELADYDLVRHKLTGKLFRTKFDATSQFDFVRNVYDEDGFLVEEYWECPILEDEQK